MKHDKYCSKAGHILWLPNRWDENDMRVVRLSHRRRATATGPLCDQPASAFRILVRVMRGRTAEYQVLNLKGEAENAFRTVADAMSWCLQRLDQEVK